MTSVSPDNPGVINPAFPAAAAAGTADLQRGSSDEINVGERVRAIRRVRRLTLKQVADAAGLSESFLSQVERAQASASIASLQRIASALAVSIADFFEPVGDRRPQVMHAADRPTLAFGRLGKKYLLTPRPLDHLEVFICEFEPDGSTGDEPYTHGDSEELLLILEGQAYFQLGESVFHLSPQDSIDYRSSIPHRLQNIGESLVRAMFIISPPSF